MSIIPNYNYNYAKCISIGMTSTKVRCLSDVVAKKELLFMFLGNPLT